MQIEYVRNDRDIEDMKQIEVTGSLYEIALDERCQLVETVELIVWRNDTGEILFTEEFDDNYDLKMDERDLRKWPEMTDYCNSYDLGLRLTGTSYHEPVEKVLTTTASPWRNG